MSYRHSKRQTRLEGCAAFWAAQTAVALAWCDLDQPYTIRWWVTCRTRRDRFVLWARGIGV